MLFGTVANIWTSHYRTLVMKYLAVLLLLAGFALAEEPTDFQLATRGTEALKAGLTDPWSMKLSMVTVYKRPTKGKVVCLVCMVFNSKNRMGGYNGDDIASFIVLSNKSRLNIADFTAAHYCESFSKEAQKGKATFADLTPQFALSTPPGDRK